MTSFKLNLKFAFIVSLCCTKFCYSNKLFLPTLKTEINQLSHHIFYFIVWNICIEGGNVKSSY